MVETGTPTQPPAAVPARTRRPGRIGGWLLPVIAVIVLIFGLSLGTWLPESTVVPNWNVVWVGYDIVFAGMIGLTWWAARAGKWWAVVCAGSVNTLQVVDVWFSLLVFYDLTERPGIGIWAFVMQPIFAVIIWRYVLARLRAAGTFPAVGAGAVVPDLSASGRSGVAP